MTRPSVATGYKTMALPNGNQSGKQGDVMEALKGGQDMVTDIQTGQGRCVILIDNSLPVGKATNAAGVIALTLGKLYPNLAGDDLVDKNGFSHPGLIPIGISILGAETEDLGKLRKKALALEIAVVDFPREGQQTNDYEAFKAAVGAIATDDLIYLGIGLYGLRKDVGKVVGKYRLFG